MLLIFSALKIKAFVCSSLRVYPRLYLRTHIIRDIIISFLFRVVKHFLREKTSKTLKQKKDTPQ